MNVAANPVAAEPSFDRYAPLLTIDPSWAARGAWLLSYALTCVTAWSAVAAPLALFGWLSGTLFRHIDIAMSEEKRQEHRDLAEFAPTSLRIFVVALVTLLLFGLALWVLFRFARPRFGRDPVDVLVDECTRVESAGQRSRITRREWLRRQRRTSVRFRAALSTAFVLGAVLWPPRAHVAVWDAHLSVGSRCLRLLAAVALGGVAALAIVVAAIVVFAAVLLVFLALVMPAVGFRNFVAPLLWRGKLGELPQRCLHTVELYQPPSLPTPPTVAIAGPTAALLCYLVADRVVDRGSPKINPSALLSGRAVERRDLAAMMLALSVWRLQRDQCLRMTVERHIIRKRLVVERQAYSERPGFEGVLLRVPSEILDALTGQDTAMQPGRLPSMTDIVQAYIEDPSADPWWEIVREVIEEGTALGLFVAVDDDTTTEPSAASHLINSAQTLADGWLRYRMAEPKVAKVLGRSTRRALRSNVDLGEPKESLIGMLMLGFRTIWRYARRRVRSWPRPVADTPHRVVSTKSMDEA